MTRFEKLMGVLGVSVSAVGASANPLLSFDMVQLAASYDSRTQALIVQSSNVDPLTSSGTIERLLSPGGAATFVPPGEGSGDQWAFMFYSSVIVDHTSESATGLGFLAVTDHNGDAFRADLQTMFRFARPGVIEVSASVRNFQFTNIVDGVFEGSNGRGWSMDFGETPDMGGDLNGEIFGGSTFFSAPFGGRDVHLGGHVVPSPLSLVVVGVGGAIVGMRRRR